MKRGHILSNDNNYYMLVRIESGVGIKDANGQNTGLMNDRYNLVNLDTGKTRVSEPARMFLTPSTQDDISLDRLRSHFNMPNLQDTGLCAGDLNFGSAVAQAVHDKRLRDATQVGQNITLLGCIDALRALGIVK